MAAQALPLILAGGAALLLFGGKKKRRGSSSKSTTPSVNGSDEPQKELPGLEDEDLDKPGSEDRPIPGPSPTPEPSPTPKLPPSPTPPTPSEPFGKPGMGPTGSGSCANSIYTRDPEYMTPDVMVAEGGFTLFQESDYFFYIRRDFQKKLYDYMLERFAAMNNGQEAPTVASVVLREGLKHFNSGCKWENPIDSLSEPEQLVWDGGRRLAVMAQFTAGREDPGFSDMMQTGERFTITRKSLGYPDPGFAGNTPQQKQALINRRVEIIATDKTQENAEHIIGEIVKLTGPNGEPGLFEVRILGNFRGSDVAPRLRLKHRFKTGSNAYFPQSGPTGIFRIFPEGME